MKTCRLIFKSFTNRRLLLNDRHFHELTRECHFDPTCHSLASSLAS